MLRRRTAALALVIVVAAGFIGLSRAPAGAVSLADQSARDRVALARAVEQYEAAQARAEETDLQVAEVSAALDRAVAEEQRYQERLQARAAAMYRSDDNGPLALLLSASTVQDLADRLELLDRLARQDARNLESLKIARAEAHAAAGQLLALQAENAQALEAVAEEVARAREDLARSESALREYEARTAAAAAAAAAKAAARRSAAPPPTDANQQLAGSGEWQVGVASHYSRNFSGRGASGEAIGPYSMILAHKTLPFGTLIEFEYKGKRAVARVVDRGPFTPGRDFDLGPGVVRVLDFSGVHEVRYRIIGR